MLTISQFNENGKLEFVYPGDIRDSRDWCPDLDSRMRMSVSKKKVEGWPGAGASKVIYCEKTSE